MSRAERLLQLMQLLRLYRYPVTGAKLADELGISVRTLYRDIATLQYQGAQIDGEPGVGYLLRPGFMLPPLMFSEEEIEALVLGSRWVASRTDTALSTAARNALAKIASVLPTDLRESLDASSLLVPRGDIVAAGDRELSRIREAIRTESMLRITYVDLLGKETERTIWPFALAFFDRVRVVEAWCVLRQDYRAFRTDRILHLAILGERYPRRRQEMLREWRDREGIPAPDG
ncbi:MAG: helix-turn-helix transcriptional regulator [Thermomicrobiales bacterium]